MLPIKLKLASLRDCYIRLPHLFINAHLNIKPGSIISLTSVQDEHNILVLWNGQYSTGEFAELDLNFAQANKINEELVIIELKNNLNPTECSSCSVKLIDESDYHIVSQHVEINLLNTCKLVTKDLVIVLWLSENVSVLVQVTSIGAGDTIGLLNEFTELQFEHTFVGPKNSQEETSHEKLEIQQPIPLISFSLGINYKLKFSFGSLLIIGERGTGKSHLLKDIVENRYKCVNSKLFNCKQLRGKRPDNVKKLFNDLINEATQRQPFILALDDVDSIICKQEEEKGQDAIYKKRLVSLFCLLLKHCERGVNIKRVAIIATAKSLESLDDRISKPKGRHYFNEVIRISFPDISERTKILKSIVTKHCEKQIKFSLTDAQFDIIAKKCNNYLPIDLKRIVERALNNTCRNSLSEFNSEPLQLKESDLMEALEGYTPINLRGVSLRSKTSETFADIGGMKEVKETLSKTILLQIKYPKLFRRSPLRTQSSVLLYGPPGCGKTLIARAITNQENLNSIIVEGPELLSKYIGASEGNVRDLFARAELARPCIIFFDEFESLVSKRGSDSTGVTDRIVNQFLTLMDGVEKLSHDVFIIAASSRPDMIDPAILRPGRLDKHIYCPPPNSNDRCEIFKVLSAKMDLDKSINLQDWANKCNNFTGADIQSLLCSAQLKALHEIMDLGQKDFDRILVKENHLSVCFGEMVDGVRERHEKYIGRYTETFMRPAEQLVATRATLA